jgi:4-hydroxybenzoate polyprenyltransferase
MLLLQLSIGALNDLADAGVDAVQGRGKPIPLGLVSRGSAQVIVVVTGTSGLALSSPSGSATLGVAAAGLGLGYLYDLRVSRTTLSWVPLALALPLVPIHAWLGATGTVPPGLVTIVPVAVIAGGALAIANGLVDLDRDAVAGRATIAVRLGRVRAWAAHSALLTIAAVLAILLAPAVPATGAETAPATTIDPAVLGLLRSGGIAVGIGLLGIGSTALSAHARRVREIGWELEAVGIAALGVGWLAGTAAGAGGGVGP